MSTIFYRAVFQLVLLFVLGSWVLLASMEKTVEGSHTVFLCQIAGKRARQNPDGSWVTPTEGVVQEAVGIQLVVMYIGSR